MASLKYSMKYDRGDLISIASIFLPQNVESAGSNIFFSIDILTYCESSYFQMLMVLGYHDRYSHQMTHLLMFLFSDYLVFALDYSCCCLPTPMTLASGGSPMFPHVVHQPASPSIWPAVQSLRRGLSTNPGVTMWCVCGCS